tara:strand:+ start:1193 stop:1564 length:372 start_codon:yes stop_codon:yes gene_type:complete
MHAAPPQTPSVLIKAKTAYALWFAVLNDFPKVRRYTLGGKIEHYFLELLESIFIALYLPKNKKIERLTTAITKLDGVKFFLQLAWENKCISQDKYIGLSEQLNEVGRMLGGWKKGLEKKTPAR